MNDQAYDLFGGLWDVNPDKEKAYEKKIQDEINNRVYLKEKFIIDIDQSKEVTDYKSQDDNFISHIVKEELERLGFKPEKVFLILGSVTFITLQFPSLKGRTKYAYRCTEHIPWCFGRDYLESIQWSFMMTFCGEAKGDQLKELLRIK